jgi:hypothetical protein
VEAYLEYGQANTYNDALETVVILLRDSGILTYWKKTSPIGK